MNLTDVSARCAATKPLIAQSCDPALKLERDRWVAHHAKNDRLTGVRDDDVIEGDGFKRCARLKPLGAAPHDDSGREAPPNGFDALLVVGKSLRGPRLSFGVEFDVSRGVSPVRVGDFTEGLAGAEVRQMWLRVVAATTTAGQYE
jgi:hypothetical protein